MPVEGLVMYGLCGSSRSMETINILTHVPPALSTLEIEIIVNLLKKPVAYHSLCGVILHQTPSHTHCTHALTHAHTHKVLAIHAYQHPQPISSLLHSSFPSTLNWGGWGWERAQKRLPTKILSENNCTPFPDWQNCICSAGVEVTSSCRCASGLTQYRSRDSNWSSPLRAR